MSTLRNNPLAKAIRFALVGGAAVAAVGPVFAADEATGDEQRIEVTGSRIKRSDTETTQPIQVVTRAEIDATGLNNVYDVLNHLSSSDGSGLSTVTTQTNGSDGSQQISLRGLGSNRSLVLVDGKRWITDGDGVVDLSTIPLAIIERIEVLKDGASAIYGSDAIAGVINLITRRDYEGAQGGVYFGQTTKNDGEQTAIDLTVGATGEGVGAVFSMSYSSQEEIMAADRKISRTPYYGCEELANHPDYNVGGTTANFLGSFCGSGSNVGGRFAGTGIPGRAVYDPTLSPDGVVDASDFRTANNDDRYNFAPVNYLQQPADRYNIFGSGYWDITEDITATARATYTKRTSVQQLAEVPLTMATNGSQGPQWTIPISEDSIYNPFGVDINTSNFRMAAVGPRRPTYDYDVFSLQLGLEGSFEVGGRAFDWDVFAARNDGQYDSRGTGYINLFNLRNALGPSFVDGAGTHCGTPGNIIRNCVPFNIFGGGNLGVGQSYNGLLVTPEMAQEMINYVSYTQVSTSGNTSYNYGGVLSGEIVELPGGMLAFAAGVESRRDQVFSQPDTLVASGGSSDNFSEPTKGTLEVDDTFIELVAPVLSDLPGVKSLEFNFSSRKSDYKAYGMSGLAEVSPDIGAPTNNKFGVRWQVFDDLMIRASKGDTFRAPSVNDLFGGGQEGFPQAFDPCNQGNWGNLNTAAQQRCMDDGVPDGGVDDTRTQLRSLSGGNPFSLKPESGTNTSVGFVYNPSWLEGFDISMDWWKIELEDAISSLGATGILTGCYVTGTQPDYCAFVERASDSSIATVRTAGFNLNTLEVRGVDLGANYKMDSSIGSWRFKLDVTKNLANETNGEDVIGKYNGSPNFEYRAQFVTGWALGDFDANWTMRFQSELTEPCWIYCYVRSGFDDAALEGEKRAGATTYHDVQANWNAPWKARFTIGARNVFGKEPPILQYNSFAHSFDASYDIPGGAYWYASYRQDF